MNAPDGGYLVFLAIALATHAVIGYALGSALFGRPRVGAVGALAADVDLLFPAADWPFVHRGVTHTLLVAGIATAAVVARHRAAGGAFGVGYASHLLVDATTPKGVPFLYPLLERSVYFDLPTTGHSPAPTVALWGGCLLLLYRRESLPRFPRRLRESIGRARRRLPEAP